MVRMPYLLQNAAEKQYSQYGKEALAIVSGVIITSTGNTL